ncbi:MAG: hypothetical protein HY268_23600 [Deltaproteobacteria bacterium]|nr:hypothetical protein [Deltaproteobacteria bacterium]
MPLSSPPPDETFTLALITSLKTVEVGLVRHSTTVKAPRLALSLSALAHPL